ncbi:MAG: hypothetical protein NXI22_00910 [bacterium]|nr:hypothetical protein [bacterium]
MSTANLNFDFQTDKAGWRVVHKRRSLGTIVGMKEPSGRHCFRLGCDTRKTPRTYRGKQKAAEALLALDELKRNANRYKWNIETIVLRAWDHRPAVSSAG